MAAELLPFTMGEYVGDLRDQGLSYINSVKSVQYLEHISQDIALNAYATYVMNLMDVAFPDNQPVGRWYQQLTSALQLIDQDVALRWWLTWSKFSYCNRLGWPQSCVGVRFAVEVIYR